jgi:hypothetical protein
MNAISTNYQERRRQRLAVLDDCLGDCHAAAREAQKRGLYSANTTLCDIEAAMMRTKVKRTRWEHVTPSYPA